MLSDIPQQLVKTKQVFISASGWPQHVPSAIPSSWAGDLLGGGSSGFTFLLPKGLDHSWALLSCVSSAATCPASLGWGLQLFCTVVDLVLGYLCKPLFPLPSFLLLLLWHLLKPAWCIGLPWPVPPCPSFTAKTYNTGAVAEPQASMPTTSLAQQACDHLCCLAQE